MTNQKLFEALKRVCGFTALESDMFEIIRAVEADKMPMTETIEQAAERHRLGDPYNNFIRGATWQSSQPNPHRITVDHLMETQTLYDRNKISYSRMVEILNEIAEGKHKERIEI
jgi:hypothetical protein